MFLVSLILFVGGIAAFGFAFSFGEPWNALLFVAGILLVSLAMAIPIHSTRRYSTIGKS